MFHLKKISLICNTEQEWDDAQREMFKLGYYWEGSGKNLTFCKYRYPRVLQNYRSRDYFGSKHLIMQDYCHYIEHDRVYEIVNIQQFKSFIRKRKLKKLKL